MIGLLDGELVVGCEDFRQPGETNYEFSELVHGIYDSGDIKRAIRYDQLYETINTALPYELRQPSVDRYWDTFVIDALIVDTPMTKAMGFFNGCRHHIASVEAGLL